MQCMGNVMVIFFMPFDPAPRDNKSSTSSEHQTLFLLFRRVWARDYTQTANGGLGMRLVVLIVVSTVPAGSLVQPGNEAGGFDCSINRPMQALWSSLGMRLNNIGSHT